jgi:hypothetical protein
MHALLEPIMGEKPALEPKAAIGPVMRAVAANILAQGRAAMVDPERSHQEAVHDFRRAMKEWRALMRLLAPFIPDAQRWRHEARDHARSLAHARDGAAALMAFDGLIDKGSLVLSERSSSTIRGRIEALRDSGEQAVLTPELRDRIVSWLDTAAAAVAQWPLDPFDFSSIAAQLTVGYRNARQQIPSDWSNASGEELHTLRQRVVDLRYQMDLIEPLWPRFGRMWTDEAGAQAIHRAASAAVALAFALDAGHRRTLDRVGASRRTHCSPAVRRAAEIVPPPAGKSVGARTIDSSFRIRKMS